ncbi:esterase OVCA2-like [Corticium candelabrum]|uniref:esterase OVCA2-like n=1 Tax=Corticium candelabrum TaxID=121492 RepID=UPI002E259EFF|nr:esterase OVCA2-like [Corticium candelabrum]
MAADRKLRILCLHGYRQSEAIFREKTGSLRKGLRKLVDPVYITAPNRVKSESEGEPHYGWWFSSPDDSFDASETSDVDNGLDKSLTLIRDTLRAEGPFDGLLGFSQGGACASIISALRENEPSEFDFKFVILVSAFVSRCTKHLKYYKSRIQCPSLHVFGSSDRVIPREWSESLVSQYEQSVVLCHAGGHYVPATASERQTYCEFLRQFV